MLRQNTTRMGRLRVIGKSEFSMCWISASGSCGVMVAGELSLTFGGEAFGMTMSSAGPRLDTTPKTKKSPVYGSLVEFSFLVRKTL